MATNKPIIRPITITTEIDNENIAAAKAELHAAIEEAENFKATEIDAITQKYKLEAQEVKNIAELKEKLHEAQVNAAVLEYDNEYARQQALLNNQLNAINTENRLREQYLSTLEAGGARKQAREQKKIEHEYQYRERSIEKTLKKTAKLEKKYQKEKEKAELAGDKEKLKRLEEQHKEELANIEERNTKSAKRKAAQKAKLEELGIDTKVSFNFLNKLSSTIDDIASNATKVNTRLNGSKWNEKKAGIGSLGNATYWEALSKKMTSVAGASTYIKQSDWANNLTSMIDAGISYNVEQRSFLMTLADNIATTFDANDSTLLKLIKIQQKDSTAARLGMEAALNEHLNSMYENTEYLKGLSASVRSSLYEAQALMTTESSAALEYTVQKWLGSMSSVGMSDEAVTGIADALGKLASGQIEAVTGGEYGNLIMMSANQIGLSVSDALSNGLDSDTTNKLMNQIVKYMKDLYGSSKDNLVVQQQLAKVYGLKASDLVAVTNLTTDAIKKTFGNSMDYAGGVSNLYSMASTMSKRTSFATALTNLKENMSYTMSSAVANNPAMYMVWQMSNVLEDLTGGINLSAISVMGSGVDLETTVAQLMKVGALSGAALTSGASIISGIANAFKGGNGMLDTLGLQNGGKALSTVSRGTGMSAKASGATTSSSGYVGNASDSAAKDKTLTDANDDSDSQLVDAKEKEGQDIKLADLDSDVMKIYEILKTALTPDGAIRVYDTSQTTVFGLGLTINR